MRLVLVGPALGGDAADVGAEQFGEVAKQGSALEAAGDRG
jgi:hypothetical protein